MPTYSQDYRALSLTTPLGQDVLLVSALRGYESISQLFSFQLDLLAEADAPVPFDRILGRPVTVELRLPDGRARYFNGMVKRFSQGARDRNFVAFQAEVVPTVWLLTKRVRSRIFQHVSVPEILRQVLAGFEVSYEITGNYYERDYCVQYRESDFDFASRLMEEEGIHYFFKHSDGSHQMVVTDFSEEHPPVPFQPNVIFEEVAGEERDDMRVTSWRKTQEVRAGEYTLWDYCFELPRNHLEANVKTIDNVLVGKVTHKLNTGNDDLEIYDYPGGYAQRFDGVDKAGGARPEDSRRIFEDRTRTVTIRMEQEEAAALQIEGTGDCGHFTAGHEFTLERHFDGDGEYLLTRVEHEAQQGDFRSRQDSTFGYQNRFTCIPRALRYRPQRVTCRPVISGLQTATVVGPPGEEIFVDKYGRVKVQFHWDREGKLNEDSSCWLRVAQFWAGKGWGAFFWPRIGQEVVVGFEEGDPDQPIVVGSVYNAENMPPMLLPATNMYCGIKSSSVRGKAGENYNSILFVDRNGREHLAIHSERHMILNAEYDVAARSGRHRSERISGAQVVTVGELPGTGGSGGGPTYKTPLGATVSGSTGWAQPYPAAELGLDSKVVYGSSFTASFPMSFQLALGGLLKLIVDPIGYQKAYDNGVLLPSAGPLLASGAWGSAQLILGTSTSITMGQAYNLIVGPDPVTYHTENKAAIWPLAHILGVIMECAAAVFLLTYALLGSNNDDWRAVAVVALQLMTEVCVAALVALANSQSLADKTIGAVISSAFGSTAPSSSPEYQLIGAAEVALFLAPIMPAVLDSIGEKELDDRQQQPS